MDKNETQKWLDGVNAELEALKIKLEPLLAERAVLEERKRLLEDLLASFDPKAAERAAVNAIDKPAPGGVVHGSVTTRVADILREEGSALHIDEILRRYDAQGYRIPGAGRPVNIIAHLLRSPMFVSAGRGIYDLAERTDKTPTAAPRRGGKYSAIAEHLSQQTVDRVILSFEEIEALIGTSLPSSARNYRAWWSTDASGSHPWVNQWEEVGWRLEQVSLNEGRATFVRVS
jgi:hypothetical protein